MNSATQLTTNLRSKVSNFLALAIGTLSFSTVSAGLVIDSATQSVTLDDLTTGVHDFNNQNITGFPTTNSISFNPPGVYIADSYSYQQSNESASISENITGQYSKNGVTLDQRSTTNFTPTVNETFSVSDTLTENGQAFQALIEFSLFETGKADSDYLISYYRSAGVVSQSYSAPSDVLLAGHTYTLYEIVDVSDISTGSGVEFIRGGFSFTTSPAPVPEPSTSFLFVFGVIGLRQFFCFRSQGTLARWHGDSALFQD